MDTIFALSSGHLPSGVAVIRVSGPYVKDLLTQFTGSIPKPRYMSLHTLYSAATNEILDQALVVYFPSPKSFTGEDCAEFHLHGSKAVVTRVLEEMGMSPGCRLAEPGEFIRRAFSGGKLDLTKVEGLADLINAETESQRRLSIMGTSGALATLYRRWRNNLVRARALIEAELDFSDAGDVSCSVSRKIWEEISVLADEILQYVLASERAGIMRDGLKIVIAGAPNSGKSSIINRLAGRNIAIVTEEAGTTRDALEIRLILGSLPVFVTDTAGLRDTENPIEKMGIDTAVRCIEEADLVLMINDMHDPQTVYLPKTSATVWSIGNKLDLSFDGVKKWPIQFSVKTGEGWSNFVEQLNTFCQNKVVAIGEVIPARKRQVALLRDGLAEINFALNMIDIGLELRAEHLRRASDCLGRIIGDIDVEDLLDTVFSEFCIGK